MKKAKVETLLSNLKVLFVEDEDATREELSRYLKRRVGKLYVGNNGVEGLNLYKEHTPNIVVTDLKMPEMDGLDMIRNIRKLDYKSSIIIISAMSDSETILKAVDIGIVKYVVKPVNTEDLISNMERVARDILKERLNETLIDNSRLIDRDKKKELEQKIRGEMAHFIKSFTGKGPQNVNAFIQGNKIDIKAKGILTLLESNLIKNNKNYSLVNYNRKLIYMDNKEQIERMLEDILESKATLVEAECDCKNDLDYIKVSFV